MNITIIHTAVHTAYLAPAFGVGVLVLPDPADDVASPTGGCSLQDADRDDMGRELAREGFAPVWDAEGEDWSPWGARAGWRPDGLEVVWVESDAAVQGADGALFDLAGLPHPRGAEGR